jgi:hypothetical protein
MTLRWRSIPAILLLTAAAAASLARAADPPLPPAAEDVIRAMLQNIQHNGFNSHPRINNGLGGLWINWRTGSRPLATNFNGSGQPDGPQVDPPRHDVLTDLRFLHALRLYKHQHPRDAQFDGELARMTPIVKLEFDNSHNERGWIYDEFIDIGNLSGDAWFKQAARNLAQFYAETFYRAGVGVMYKTNAKHPRGYYRADLALEAGCALIQAGTLFGEPSWTAKGQQIVRFVYEHAYLPEYHVFLHLMDEVLLGDGTVNPNEKILREKVGHTNVDGGLVRMGEIGQEITSLLHVYLVIRDKTFLDRATDMLDRLSADPNTLGLWDAANLGYFNGIGFPGPDAGHPGKPSVSRSKKESGRQFHMLQAFHLANCLTGDRYRAMQQAMLEVTLKKAYFPAGRGMVYEMASDWSRLTMKNGQRADWVTSEAMRLALLALLGLNEKQPW